MRFMFSQHPKLAKKWASETPNEKDLPEKKKSPWLGMKSSKEDGGTKS